MGVWLWTPSGPSTCCRVRVSRWGWLECTRYFLLRVLVVLTQYHHPLVGVATIAASYPFLTAIIFWKGVTIEGSEVMLGHGMFMISTVDRLPSKGTLSSVHHCCQSLNKSPG